MKTKVAHKLLRRPKRVQKLPNWRNLLSESPSSKLKKVNLAWLAGSDRFRNPFLQLFFGLTVRGMKNVRNLERFTLTMSGFRVIILGQVRLGNMECANMYSVRYYDKLICC